jgi:hypothetical protein
MWFQLRPFTFIFLLQIGSGNDHGLNYFEGRRAWRRWFYSVNNFDAIIGVIEDDEVG